MQQIPLTQTPSQTLHAVLAGQSCTLSLYWRQTRLYLDLNVGAQVICRGALCENLAGIVQSPSRHFNGSLHFLDLEGNRPPHWQELHTGRAGRYALLFVEEGEELPPELRF